MKKLIHYIIFIQLLFITNKIVMAQDSFENFIEIEGELVFEEINGSIINTELSWVYNIDTKSNIIETNLKGHNVTLFDSDGKFINRFGSLGRGPGDFEYPISGIGLSNGTILVSEFSGKLTQFTSTGDSLLRVINTDIIPLSNIIEIEEDKILLIGSKKENRGEGKLLHILNLKNEEIESSFHDLSFAHGDYAQVFRMSAQLAVATLIDSKIYVLSVPFTKVYVYDSKGRLLNDFELSIEEFKNVEKKQKSLSSSKLFEYVTTFSRIERVFSFNDGTFLLQYSNVTKIDVTNPADRSFEYGLAYFDSFGSKIFELNNTPELMAVDKQNSTLFFRNNDQNPTFLLKGKIK